MMFLSEPTEERSKNIILQKLESPGEKMIKWGCQIKYKSLVNYGFLMNNRMFVFQTGPMQYWGHAYNKQGIIHLKIQVYLVFLHFNYLDTAT